MRHFSVKHVTRYVYASDVSLSQQVIRVQPRATQWQMVYRATATVTPEPASDQTSIDSFGNARRMVLIEKPHKELTVAAESHVSLAEPDVHDPQMSLPWEQAKAEAVYLNDQTLKAIPFAYPSPYTPISADLEAFARISFTPGRPLLDAAIDLNSRIFNEFKFDPNATTVDTKPSHVLKNKRGVCQDFTHLMLAAMRSLHLPVRYVSGYLLTQPPEGEEKMVGADASHAWVSIYDPNLGWIGLDPTNGLLPKDTHITLAYGFDYGDVAPVAGVVYGGGAQTLDVAVDVVEVERN